MNLRELPAGCLQSMNQHLSNTPHQLVSKIAVPFGLGAEASSIQKDRGGWLQCAGIKMPVKRREQPGPSQHVPIADRLNWNRLAVRLREFKKHRAVLDQVKTTCQVA